MFRSFIRVALYVRWITVTGVDVYDITEWVAGMLGSRFPTPPEVPEVGTYRYVLLTVCLRQIKSTSEVVRAITN